MINMDGRMYDPVPGRFLSPDPFVQAPDFTRGLNRYIYCLNNPLSFTDPSGYSWLSDNWKSLTSAIVGIVVAALPGEWEEMIPIWGLGRAAIDHYQTGHPWKGTLQVGLAIPDKGTISLAGKYALRKAIASPQAIIPF